LGAVQEHRGRNRVFDATRQTKGEVMLRHVDLCSGIGGFSLGFEWAELSKPVLFCDIEPWSRQILAKHWPDVPIAEDVKELADDPDGLVPDCDIITAGYPCQPFSQAGQRRGTEDDRHIWPYIFSIIQGKRPTWCVFENVYGHVTLGLDEVLSDLERESYATRPFVVPACATDAPHRRDRLWIICRNVGNPKNERCEEWSDVKREGAENKQEQRLGVRGKPSGSGQDVADTYSQRRKPSRTSRKMGSAKKKERGTRDQSDVFVETSNSSVADTQSMYSNVSGKHTEQSKRQVSKLGERGGKINVAYTSSTRLQGCEQLRENEKQTGTRREGSDGSASKRSDDARGKANFWLAEPRVGRVAHGIPRRVDRLKGLGNAIVPQIAMRIGQTIKATYDA